MPTPIQLIVGLGNPGTKYANTRHNAGAWLVEELSRTANCELRAEGKFHGSHAQTLLYSQKCHLAIPTTYMNRSGACVFALANFYNIPPEAILIVHDEIDLPVGIARLKFDGGAGGHNGLSDIINHLHTKQFYRLRIGVGRPMNSEDVVDYVLDAPSKSDRKIINAVLAKALGVLPLIVQGEIQKAMQELHSDSGEEGSNS